MSDHVSLGDLQQLVMLAMARLEDGAYGAAVQREVEEVAGRSVSVSTVYVTLVRLEKQGLVCSRRGEPTPVRGGKPKRFFRLTTEGSAALLEVRESLARMWRGLELEAR